MRTYKVTRGPHYDADGGTNLYSLRFDDVIMFIQP